MPPPSEGLSCEIEKGEGERRVALKGAQIERKPQNVGQPELVGSI